MALRASSSTSVGAPARSLVALCAACAAAVTADTAASSSWDCPGSSGSARRAAGEVPSVMIIYLSGCRDTLRPDARSRSLLRGGWVEGVAPLGPSTATLAPAAQGRSGALRVPSGAPWNTTPPRPTSPPAARAAGAAPPPPGPRPPARAPPGAGGGAPPAGPRPARVPPPARAPGGPPRPRHSRDRARDRHPAQPLGEQPAHGLHVLGLDADAEQLRELLDRQPGGDPGPAFAEPFHRGLLLVVLVSDLADDLLENVLDGDQPRGAAVLVDHDREMNLARLHLPQQ